MRKFESVKEGDIVRFNNGKVKDSGVVVSVGINTFTIRKLMHYDTDGYINFYHAYFTFLKTGRKSDKNYYHGSAIDIIGSIN